MMTEIHSRVQSEIAEICISLGLPAEIEHRGKGWRADMFTTYNGRDYAFEIQVSPQSLKTTEARQQKYIDSNITACWLFEKEPKESKQKELEHLPIFRFYEENGKIYVSIKNREFISLFVFVRDFIMGRFKFCHTMKASKLIGIRFLPMNCYRCGKDSYVCRTLPLKSNCKAMVDDGYEMWSDDKIECNPEIIAAARNYAELQQYRGFALATLKNRYSNFIGKSYMSYGCPFCNSIFGDWYIHEAEIESCYDDNPEVTQVQMSNNFNIVMEMPHWCHSEDGTFCE